MIAKSTNKYKRRRRECVLIERPRALDPNNLMSFHVCFSTPGPPGREREFNLKKTIPRPSMYGIVFQTWFDLDMEAPRASTPGSTALTIPAGSNGQTRPLSGSTEAAGSLGVDRRGIGWCRVGICSWVGQKIQWHFGGRAWRRGRAWRHLVTTPY